MNSGNYPAGRDMWTPGTVSPANDRQGDEDVWNDRDPWGTPIPPLVKPMAAMQSPVKETAPAVHRIDATPIWPFPPAKSGSETGTNHSLRVNVDEANASASWRTNAPASARHVAARPSKATRRSPYHSRGRQAVQHPSPGRRQQSKPASPRFMTGASLPTADHGLTYRHPATPLFSPRIPLPSVLSRVDSLQPMGEATKYLLSHYLAFDELVESEEGAKLLGQVLEKFLGECFAGANDDVREALTASLGSSVALPKLTRARFPDTLWCVRVLPLGIVASWSHQTDLSHPQYRRLLRGVGESEPPRGQRLAHQPPPPRCEAGHLCQHLQGLLAEGVVLPPRHVLPASVSGNGSEQLLPAVALTPFAACVSQSWKSARRSARIYGLS